jgi:putative hemolysin
VIALGIVGLTACGNDSPDASGSSIEDARVHCTDSGGEALVARPQGDTNSDQENCLELAGSVELCRFEDGEPGARETTRIYVDLVTLYAEEPTLAGVAYLSRVPVTLPETPSANPARFNCAALGGSAQFGGEMSSSGWVTSDRPAEVVDLCVFPDLSFIDEFGIFYYADGTVRGADLATVMRYEGGPLPAIF